MKKPNQPTVPTQKRAASTARLRILSMACALVLCLSLCVGCLPKDHTDELNALNITLGNAVDEIHALKTEKDALAQEIAMIQKENESIRAELAALEAANQALRDSIPYENMQLTVAGVSVNAQNAADILGDGGSLRYDAANRILILENAQLSIKAPFVLSSEDLAIQLLGENRITLDGTSSERVYGISCNDHGDQKDLSLIGKGSLALHIQTGENTKKVTAILAENLLLSADLSVETGNVEERARAIECTSLHAFGVTATVKAGSAMESTAVYAFANVEIADSAFEIRAGGATERSEGMAIMGTLSLHDSAVRSFAGECTQNAYDIRCLGSVQFYGDVSLPGDAVYALGGIWNCNGYPNTPVEKIKIYIDQGHNPSNYHNSGAEGNGLKEQDLTYQFGHMLADLLKEDGRFEVCLSRPTADTVLGTDSTTSLAARVSGAKEFGADYFISLHINAFTSESANGIEVLVANQEGESYLFGKALLDGVVASTGLRERGMVLRPELYVLKNATMPAALVELGFISNVNDSNLMKNSPHLFTEGLYAGILQYFNLSAP